MSSEDAKLLAQYANKLRDIRLAQNEILDKYRGHGEGQDHRIGTWPCEKSPVGVCIYHRYKDPASDQCIYCGNPHERK